MPFEMIRGALACDGVSLEDLAREHGTPLYVYSAATLIENIRRLQSAFAGFDALAAYSVKANSNLAVLRLALREGCGLDIVSGGELLRARAAGAAMDRVIFAGVGKSEAEIAEGLRAGIGMFNVESTAEVSQIDAVAQALGRRARIALRVNPHVEVETHRYITTGTAENKFGIDFTLLPQAVEAVDRSKMIDLAGLHCHIGSQILDAAPYRRAAERAGELIDELRRQGHTVTHLNLGGGHGIAYQAGQSALSPAQVADAVGPTLRRLRVKLILEPGRSLAGPAGVLLTRVMIIKRGVKKTFAIVDAAMNDLMRPCLYGAHHRIEPVREDVRGNTCTEMDIVGPVCESSDFLAKDRPMPMLSEGDLLAVRDAGAYGMVMASNYNTRARAAELLVLDGQAHVVRPRETVESLLAADRIPSALA
ncbi:MAG: diaminopimelate decarboxylase [Candidatus Sumerlaeia bacterium]|nr:diaminopimelate decarboxylase [Candidatus Sumerlaeia bacterium]